MKTQEYPAPALQATIMFMLILNIYKHKTIDNLVRFNVKIKVNMKTKIKIIDFPGNPR